MEYCNFFKMTFLKRKKNSSAASDSFMLYWDQCTKPIKWFSPSLMVTSLPFLMLQNYPNFWFYPYTRNTDDDTESNDPNEKYDAACAYKEIEYDTT